MLFKTNPIEPKRTQTNPNEPKRTQTNPIYPKPKMTINLCPEKHYARACLLRPRQNEPNQTQFPCPYANAHLHLPPRPCLTSDFCLSGHTALLLASLETRIPAALLRFADTLPPSGCAADLKLQVGKHARHTKKRGLHHRYRPRICTNILSGQYSP
jgi:hypothetical protein